MSEENWNSLSSWVVANPDKDDWPFITEDCKSIIWASERIAELEKEKEGANAAIRWLHNEADVYASEFYGTNDGIKGEVDYSDHKAAIERATD